MAANGHPPDRIILEGMQFYGFHGVNPEERALGQSYLVDLSIEMDLLPPGISDRLEDTLSYTRLYRSVQAVLEGESKTCSRRRPTPSPPGFWTSSRSKRCGFG